VTIGAVIGADGVLVIDTRATVAQGEQLRDDLRRITSKPVRWVVNTHWHFDHCFGNAGLDDAAKDTAEIGPQIWSHPTVPTMLSEHGDTVREWLAGRSAQWAADMDALVIATPTEPVETAAVIDLGDRTAELIHPGRGHTDGDIVVKIRDADVLYAGDLIEESGPPAFGDDSFPLDWAGTLSALDVHLTDATTVVPGHGNPVDRSFVTEQREAIVQVATTISELADAGVSLDEALRHTEWPFPADGLAQAVRRGYQSLGAE
jgi:glyoxylase-like metal-dependent hydrolase (beta-lactamase superfamily II)